jgi:hypothetical protein
MWYIIVSVAIHFVCKKFVHHLNSSLPHCLGAMIVVSSTDNSCVILVGQMVEDRVLRVPISSLLSQN